MDVPLTIETEEFEPLPHYVWAQRPSSLPLELQEVRTALAVANGDIPQAALLLKVSIVRLNRWLRANPQIAPLVDELYDVLRARWAAEPIRALFDSDTDNRRREWGFAQVARSRLVQGHALAPSSPSSMSELTLADGPRRITYRWRTDADDADDALASDSPIIDHDPDSDPDPA